MIFAGTAPSLPPAPNAIQSDVEQWFTHWCAFAQNAVHVCVCVLFLQGAHATIQQSTVSSVPNLTLHAGTRQRGGGGGRTLLEDRPATQTQSASANHSAVIDACDAECTISTNQSGTDALNNSITSIRVTIPKRASSAKAVLVPTGQLLPTLLTKKKTERATACKGTKSNVAPKTLCRCMQLTPTLLVKTVMRGRYRLDSRNVWAVLTRHTEYQKCISL